MTSTALRRPSWWDAPAPPPPAPAPPPLPPARPAGSSCRSANERDERAALIEFGAEVPHEWAEGFAALVAMPPPSGFPPERWQRIIGATGVFLDRWAGEAIRCGWSDLDVFGCYDTAPTARRDAMGLLMLLDGCEIVAIDPDGADLVTAGGAHQRFHRRSLPPGTVSLWRLGEATILDASELVMAEPAEAAPDAPRPASPQETAAEERPRSGFAAVWGDASKGIDL